ncbi:MAG: tetratricopeptide repeat protein [Verrucomicrobia bacterium]|nr:tetratricopeptide repeat protein [Verrucomicrobiota bacterium]
MNILRILHFIPLICLVIAIPCPVHGEDKSAADAGVPRDPDAPKDAEGQYRLAQAWMRGAGGKKDLRKAYELFKMAADQGHTDAIGAIGWFYAKGIIVKMDLIEAAEWYRKGAEKGSASSQLNYGLALIRGQGLPVNESEGMKWIDKSAEQGQPEANSLKGDFFSNGASGHRKDYQEAFRHYLTAAKAGHPGAECMVGEMYFHGLGQKVDETKAEYWLRKSAMQGDPMGMSKLSDLLGVENSKPAKRTESIKWLILAKEAGEPMAKRGLVMILPGVPEALLKEAQKQASEFKPQPERRANR